MVIRRTGGVSIGITDLPTIDECIKYIIDNNISEVCISLYENLSAWERKYDDVWWSLDFLQKMPHMQIRSLHFDGQMKGFSNLYSFTQLDDLLLTIKNGETLDLSRFSKLRKLHTGNLSVFKNLDKLELIDFGSSEKSVNLEMINSIPTIEELHLGEVKNFHFSHIPNLTKLKRVSLWQVSIKDFGGIECFINIDSISVTRCMSLTSIQGIGVLSALQSVYFANIPKLAEYSELCKCQNIVKLEFDGIKNGDLMQLRQIKSLRKMILSNCGSIPSIKFIDDLPNLEFFSFVDTNVLDGDLTPCLRLKYAGTLDKRHYNLKSDKLPKGNVTA
jgi:hypothetical protein